MCFGQRIFFRHNPERKTLVCELNGKIAEIGNWKLTHEVFVGGSGSYEKNSVFSEKK